MLLVEFCLQKCITVLKNIYITCSNTKIMCRVILYLNLHYVLLFFLNPQCGNAGCASIATCCPGRNNTCSLLSNGHDDCFCDQYCISIQDCCSDYVDYCINRGENTKQKHNDAMHYLRTMIYCCN